MTTGTLIATIMLICYMIFGFAVANYCFKKYLYHMNGKWIVINILACGLLSLYMQYFVVAVYHIVRKTHQQLQEEKASIEYVKFPEESKKEEKALTEKRKDFVPDTLD
ncbi:hypothetical protein [Burkholderia cenocepacia]|uniref:hypothetical protein n=1 Tax=Burkholderia cenocepacia TaxID=95486 RepID=UPI000980D044|nr:hypothetical protein [Burkholderia cenocepacia]ONU47751.1 hypothetical protein A8E62_32045 [Burkholderia cenocepacia]ONU88338.1 hypothetical protein A8E63_14690 [Burkholderia cenocepacia]